MNTFEIQQVMRGFRNAEGFFQEIQNGPGPIIDYTLGIFSTAMVSLLLEKKYGQKTTDLRSEITKNLLDVRNTDGTWSFDGPGGIYPPDIDDTILALSATREELGYDETKRQCRHILEHRVVWKNGLVCTYLDQRRSSPLDIIVNLHTLIGCQRIGYVPKGLKDHVKSSLYNKTGMTGYYCSERYIRFVIEEALDDEEVKDTIHPALTPHLSLPGEVLFRRRSEEVSYQSPAVSYLLDRICRIKR